MELYTSQTQCLWGFSLCLKVIKKHLCFKRCKNLINLFLGINLKIIPVRIAGHTQASPNESKGRLEKRESKKLNFNPIACRASKELIIPAPITVPKNILSFLILFLKYLRILEQ